MCRMSLVLSKGKNKYLEVLQKKAWASHNRDGVGVYFNNRDKFNTDLQLKDKLGWIMRYEKSAWLDPIESEYDRYMSHFRFGTGGSGTHPFNCSCKNKDNYWFLTHNGVLQGWRKIKEELEVKGHKFATQIDSEVMVHLFEETEGKGSLLARAKELMKLFYSYEGTSYSSVNLLFYNAFTDQWLAISDDSLNLIMNGQVVILTSDNDWLPQRTKYRHLYSGDIAWGKGLYVNIKESAIVRPQPPAIRVGTYGECFGEWDFQPKHCKTCSCASQYNCSIGNPCTCCSCAEDIKKRTAHL